jgi:hypothetical protein
MASLIFSLYFQFIGLLAETTETGLSNDSPEIVASRMYLAEA